MASLLSINADALASKSFHQLLGEGVGVAAAGALDAPGGRDAGQTDGPEGATAQDAAGHRDSFF